MMNRRRMLFTVGGAGLGALVLAACGSDDGASSSGSTNATATSSSSTARRVRRGDTTASTTGATTADTTAATTGSAATTECVSEIPDETGGPYPGDGTNGVNVLTEDGIVRSDITSSFGSSTTTTDGIPLELVLTIQDAASCTPLPGAAVYLWHCTAAGEYSLYSSTVVDENFLRGVQESDANGQVRFTTVVPGCYDGRWPHMHFEIFEALTDAVSGRNSIKTTQLAIPAAVAEAAYTDSRYPRSASNLARRLADVRHGVRRRRRSAAAGVDVRRQQLRLPRPADRRHLIARLTASLTGNSQKAVPCWQPCPANTCSSSTTRTTSDRCSPRRSSTTDSR